MLTLLWLWLQMEDLDIGGGGGWGEASSGRQRGVCFIPSIERRVNRPHQRGMRLGVARWHPAALVGFVHLFAASPPQVFPLRRVQLSGADPARAAPRLKASMPAFIKALLIARARRTGPQRHPPSAGIAGKKNLFS